MQLNFRDSPCLNDVVPLVHTICTIQIPGDPKKLHKLGHIASFLKTKVIQNGLYLWVCTSIDSKGLAIFRVPA